jgi:hypothetical protein
MADFAVDLCCVIRVQDFRIYCFRRRVGRMPALPAISINSLSQRVRVGAEIWTFTPPPLAGGGRGWGSNNAKLCQFAV